MNAAASISRSLRKARLLFLTLPVIAMAACTSDGSAGGDMFTSGPPIAVNPGNTDGAFVSQ